MKKTRVILKADHGIVRSEREGHQLHAKGFTGEPLSGGGLKLDLVETAHLLLKGTVEVYHKKEKRELGPAEFVHRCRQKVNGFDRALKAYQETRGRGFFVKLDGEYLSVFLPTVKNTGRVPYAKLLCFAEDEELEFGKVLGDVKRLRKLGIVTLGAVVDAEGDVSYFRFEEFREEGSMELRKEHLGMVEELKGLFGARDPPIFRFSFSGDTSQCFFSSTHPEQDPERLLNEKLFFGKPCAQGLTLGWYEGCYLHGLFEKEIGLSAKQMVVSPEDMGTGGLAELEGQPLFRLYRELKQRNLVPKTGFKYGSHFRVYRKLEEGHHAEYLVHLVEEGHLPWFRAELMVRLATGVGKEMVFAFLDGKDDKKIRYLRVLRELPSPGKE